MNFYKDVRKPLVDHQSDEENSSTLYDGGSMESISTWDEHMIGIEALE